MVCTNAEVLAVEIQKKAPLDGVLSHSSLFFVVRISRVRLRESFRGCHRICWGFWYTTMLKSFKRLAIELAIESGSPLTCRSGFPHRHRRPTDATSERQPAGIPKQRGSPCRWKRWKPLRTRKETAVHLRNGSATIYGSAAARSDARKSARVYDRPGHPTYVSLCPSTRQLSPCYLRQKKASGSLGRSQHELVDQLAASIVGGEDGGALNREGIF